MAKVAILITDLFEDSEYLQPAKAFMEAGHEIVHIGLKAGATVKGKKKETPVTIDRAVKKVKPDEFDALFIPGGYSPDKLRVDDDAVRLVRHTMEADKPVFVICHGPQLLITACALAERRVTGWKSIMQDIVNAGGIFLDKEVVIDGNLISSRSPKDLPAFVRACLAKLG